MRHLYRWSGMYHFSMSDIGYAGAVLAFLTFIYWNKIIKKKMKEKAVCC